MAANGWTTSTSPRPSSCRGTVSSARCCWPRTMSTSSASAQAVTDQMHDPVNHPRARGDRHEFGDTKFRVIRYTMRATTRFREYLPTALFEQRDEVTRVGPIAEGPATTFGADDDPGAPVVVSETGVGLNTIVKSSTPPDDPGWSTSYPRFDGPRPGAPASWTRSDRATACGSGSSVRGSRQVTASCSAW